VIQERNRIVNDVEQSREVFQIAHSRGALRFPGENISRLPVYRGKEEESEGEEEEDGGDFLRHRVRLCK
jgi:hypothetical protein